jgi:hypothetical protein
MAPSGRQSLHGWLAVGAGAVGLGLVRIFEKQLAPVMPPCPFHALTGLYCPGCGSTRATRALLHGDLLAAWHFNPLFVLTLPLMAAILISAQVSPRPLGGSPRLGWSVLAAIVLFGIARNLPFAPFTALAPH